MNLDSAREAGSSLVPRPSPLAPRPSSRLPIGLERKAGERDEQNMQGMEDAPHRGATTPDGMYLCCSSRSVSGIR